MMFMIVRLVPLDMWRCRANVSDVHKLHVCCVPIVIIVLHAHLAMGYWMEDAYHVPIPHALTVKITQTSVLSARSDMHYSFSNASHVLLPIVLLVYLVLILVLFVKVVIP